MAVNMDDDDRNFFIKWFNDLKKDIKEDIQEVRNHQKKTCDELDEVDKKVIGIGNDLKNHLENTKKEESKKLENQKSSREKKALTVSIISTCVAIITVVVAVFANGF